MTRESKRAKTACNAELRGKDVLVAGASRGIGFEVSTAEACPKKLCVLKYNHSGVVRLQFVKQLEERGNRVQALVRREGGDELHALQRKNGNITISQVDVSDPAAIKASLLTSSKAILAQHVTNGSAIGQAWASQTKQVFDYALMVAGVVDDWADLDEVDEPRMLHCFRVNTIGPLLLAQALVVNGLLQSGSVLANFTSKVNSPLQKRHRLSKLRPSCH